MISEVDGQKLNELDAILYNANNKQLIYVPNLLQPNFKVLMNKADKSRLNVKDTKAWFLNHIKSVVDACCKGQVSPQYITDHQALCNIFILFRNTTKNEIVGFITSYTRGEGGDDYFIDVICSAGYGKYQLKFFTDFFYLYGGAKSVSLAALPHVLYYYKKFGYEHKHSCADVPFPQPDFGKDTPANMNSAFARNNFKEYMSDLQTHQFSAKKYYRQNPENGSSFDVCKSPVPLDKEDLRICAIDGFYMKHCLTPDYQAQIVQSYMPLDDIPPPAQLLPYLEKYSTDLPDLAISGEAVSSSPNYSGLRSRTRSRFPSSNSGYGSNNGTAAPEPRQLRKRSANNNTNSSAFLTVPAFNNGATKRIKRTKLTR